MKTWLIRGSILLAAVTLLLAGTLYVAFRLTVVRSLPPNDGIVHLQGIEEAVEIVRDTFGVPHIQAANEADLYFAMGYAMAQDRLWQMDFYRRLGQGRLAEVFGPELVPVDRYFRTLTAGRSPEPIAPAFKPYMEAFSNGINAFIQAPGRVLPLEFRLLGYRPEPWQTQDYLAIVKLMAWQLSSGWKIDLAAARIFNKVGAARFREAFPHSDATGRVDPDPALAEISGLLADTLHLQRQVKRLTGFTPMPASNNWVVSGRKTASGMPLLANDTHMGLENPSLWWEVHLNGPDLTASGFTVPGLPAIVLGHNQAVAWGITAVMSDDVDFFIEKLNPDNELEYRYRGQWETFQTVTEKIRVKGRPSEVLKIRVGRNGPVFKSGWGKDKSRVVAARWAFNERPISSLAAYRLAKATDINQVAAALQDWELPALNFVAADTAGSIGYWCCAAIPIRQQHDGLLPTPGWTGEYAWQGYLPFDERPHILNPAEGYLASANNDVTPAGYPYFVTSYWAPPHRIQRIRQMLDPRSDLTVADMRNIQLDVYSPLAADIVPAMVRILQQTPADRIIVETAERLAAWDFKMSSDSPEACIFDMTVLKLLRNIFADEMGEDLYRIYLDMVIFAPQALRQVFRQTTSPWVDDVTSPATEKLDAIVIRSLAQAIDELTTLLGNNPDHWRWDRLQHVTFTHVMGKRRHLDRIFNLGPFPVAGSHLTVNKALYDYNDPFQVTEGVAQRLIVDLGNLSNTLHVLPTGESGHLASPHYQDQTGLYLSGNYHPVWTDAAQLEAHTEAVLRLLPVTE